MPSARFVQAVLFQEVLDRAQRHLARGSQAAVPRSKEKCSLRNQISVRFEGKDRLRAYGKRFMYRDQKGRWNAIDALISGERLTGIALRTPAAAAKWVATLRNTRRRRNPEADFTRPAFIMTPGYNLHFVSFP